MLSIVKVPDPILNQVCEPCDIKHDKTLKRLSTQMASLMYKTNGCGIAAPQVGVSKRIVVIDCDYTDNDKDPIVLINPVIVELRGQEEEAGEGCLSLPGITIPVSRKPWARVRYYDLDGELWEIEGDGLLGRCLQHEIDHLDGKTMLESCDPKYVEQALKDYEEAKKAGAKPGDVDLD